MFKCTSVCGHDNVKPWDFLKFSKAWIPVLYVLCVLTDEDAASVCVLTDADAASRRSVLSAITVTGMAPITLSACDASLLKYSRCLRDIASAILFSMPDTCKALNWILFSIHLVLVASGMTYPYQILIYVCFICELMKHYQQIVCFFPILHLSPYVEGWKKLTLISGKWYPAKFVCSPRFLAIVTHSPLKLLKITSAA